MHWAHPHFFLCSYTYTAEDVAKLLEEKKARGAAPRNAGGRAD